MVSVGANTGEPEETTLEFFSPPTSSEEAAADQVGEPRLVALGGSFTVRTDEARVAEGVVVMKPGANTHQMNFDQRSVPLAVDASRSVLAVDLLSPRSANPPGYPAILTCPPLGGTGSSTALHVRRRHELTLHPAGPSRITPRTSSSEIPGSKAVIHQVAPASAYAATSLPGRSSTAMS